MILNQKRAAQVILAKRDEKGKESAAPMASEHSHDPRHAIAEDMILAMKNGSASDLVQALSAWDAMAEAAEGDEDDQSGTESAC